MKYIILLLLSFAFLFGNKTDAQDCPGSLKPYFLNGNNIKASFLPRGNKFFSGNNGEFLVPFPADKELSTIFASTPWIGGYDDAGNFKGVFETYPSIENGDYSVGPLSSIGILYDSICSHYDRVWTVYGEDIRAHKLDFYDNFKIDDTIVSIFQWPARGNKHFKKHFKFELPFDNQGLAPFHDANGNNIYDPENGDYPIVFPQHSHEYIPDQILWMVFNDLSSNDENPLRFEIQLTAFAYHCTDNAWLNNTIFNRYKVIDRAVTSLDSVFFGLWTDYDLGCHTDDFIGSDTIRNSEFVYNDNNGDGDPGLDCSGGVETYGANPPVQSMTYLSHPMYSFIEARSPVLSTTFYKNLNGQWNDGSPVYPTGEGYDPGSSLQPTRFLYPGDPRDPNSWSANNVLAEGKGYRTVSSIKLGRMDPGSVKEIYIAYQFHHHPDSSYNGQLSLMYNNIDSLLSSSYLGEDCSPFPYCFDGDCVWPGDFNKNGIADHYDLLHWGVMNNSTGPQRNGLVSWRGHYADDWNNSIPEGPNYKHGDGDGNGLVDTNDLSYNEMHFKLTNPVYHEVIEYPEGPEILISSDNINSSGSIRNLTISTGIPLENVLGIAFELEYDTTIFKTNLFLHRSPGNTNSIMYTSPGYQMRNSFISIDGKYAAVNSINQAIDIPADITLLKPLNSSGLFLKPGLTVDDIPDTVRIRLRNLIAIDAEGNNLNIGANQLVLLKGEITSSSVAEQEIISIYPNPSDNTIYITTPVETKAELISTDGRIVKTLFLTHSNEVDVSDLQKGIYFIKMAAAGRTIKISIQ